MKLIMTFDDTCGAMYIEIDHNKKYKVSKEINDNVCYDVDIEDNLRGIEILGIDSIELKRYIYTGGEVLSDINVETETIAFIENKRRV